MDAIMGRITYDTAEFGFAELVCAALDVPTLEGLEPSAVVATRETDQGTVYHKQFYAHLDQFLPVYRRFVRALLGEEQLQKVYVQRIPTFRVHLRNSLAVGTWHRDREFGHDPAEVNYWVPFTAAYGNNTVWIDGSPVAAQYGEVIVFDGANMLHGNVINDTPHSRVSIDFRTLDRDLYRPREDRSVSFGVRFSLGEYWDAF
jgi:hypothetical protein